MRKQSKRYMRRRDFHYLALYSRGLPWKEIAFQLGIQEDSAKSNFYQNILGRVVRTSGIDFKSMEHGQRLIMASRMVGVMAS